MEYDGRNDDMFVVDAQNQSRCNAEIRNSPEITNLPEIPHGVPYVGLEFDSMEEARDFYEEYGKQLGFCIRTRTTVRNRPRSNEITGALFVCVHEGKLMKNQQGEEPLKVVGDTNVDFNKKKSRITSTFKMGCKASMRVACDKYKPRWIVTAFEHAHNHQCVTPKKRNLMKSCKRMPIAVKGLTESFYNAGLRISALPAIFGGDHAVFDSRDCYNHLKQVRHRNLEMGDAQSVLTYFQQKQADNLQFYYAIQCDEEGRAVNFFWVDPRARMAYQCFGDVVTFDTTYRTNKYDMPFAPFTGVNHHFQSIQFGCALLQDETEVTFMWLFSTWLQAMGGCPPVSIITDQDPAMKAAICKVFPQTRHRLCLWHIKKKFVEKLAHVYATYGDFKKQITRCLHWTYTEEEFEEEWKRMMFQFNLSDNGWLTNLYEIRHLWVPVYLRGTFFAGMNTTGRSEGIKSFFDEFVTSRTNLREFVEKYDQAVKKLVRNETNEDFVSEHKLRVVDPLEFLLSHAAEVYTRVIFTKFKEEWDGIRTWKIDEEELFDDMRIFHVKTRDSIEGHKQYFVVQWNPSTHEALCTCKHFEFSGMLCRHMLKVMARLDLERIPESLIHRRWRKGANKFRYSESLNQEIMDGDNEHATTLRLNYLTQQWSKLSCRASPYYEAFVICRDMFDEASKKVEIVIDSAMSRLAATMNASQVASNFHDISDLPSSLADDPRRHSLDEMSQMKILDPNVSKTKGQKKGKEIMDGSGRMKSSLELATMKRKRRCNGCGQMARYDIRNCPLNPRDRIRTNADSPEEEEEDDSDDD